MVGYIKSPLAGSGTVFNFLQFMKRKKTYFGGEVDPPVGKVGQQQGKSGTLWVKWDIL